MTTKLSSKGQVVLPKQVRSRLRLRPGATFDCKIRGDSIVLTPEGAVAEPPRSIRDAKSGLCITQSPAEVHVTSEDVRVVLHDFP